MDNAQLNQTGTGAMQDIYMCPICGSTLERNRRYLAAGGENLKRDFVYILPAWAIEALASFNFPGNGKIASVVTNNKFFRRRNLYWCAHCNTGVALPFFYESELDIYYQEFYWEGREQHEEYFGEAFSPPREARLDWVRCQLDWVIGHGVKFSSAIDFGAGDCAGAYLMSKACGAKNVYVVDASVQARRTAESIGVSYFKSLDEVPHTDFIYGSHSIEHVADLVQSFKLMEEKLLDGGHVLLETPNIADKEVFSGLVMTPHTFMLSESSFRELSKLTRLKLIAAETFGPKWSENHKVSSQGRTDLRVLFKKISA